ncbi:GTPase IMAP family member 8 [Astyanax mexicanus]|uniref:GTPase IMAP family member 8 n=1 Tax=Astyanax mexicanus TaxID=7994 RepID=UPI0020CAE6F3|nr:GTPase IMAP family member 8 [Astyanax mexicanus]
MASYTQKTSTDDSVQIVLIGNSGSGKSCSGNTILNKKHFLSDASEKSVTLRCQIETEIINGRTVTVVDTPGWDCTERSLQEVEREIQQVLQTLNGPYSFLLVIRVGLVEVEEINKIYRLKKVLGSSYLEHTTILFSHNDNLEFKTFEQFIREGGKEFQGLLRSVGHRCHSWNNRDERSDEDVEKVLENLKNTEIKKTLEIPPKETGSCGKRFRKEETLSIDAQICRNTVRVLFLGMTKGGKTSSIRTLQKHREQTENKNVYKYVVTGLSLQLIDSPGFDENPEEIQKIICESVSTYKPHVMMIVMNFDRFTPAKKRIMQHVQDCLGRNAAKHTMFLFTGKDDLEGEQIDRVIQENTDVCNLVSWNGNRFHALNNRDVRDRRQVEELLQKIAFMHKKNRGEFYKLEKYPGSVGEKGTLLSSAIVYHWDEMASYTQKTSTDASVQIVLIGNSGSGKSCFGNTILNKKHFLSDASGKSVTLRCQIETEIINGRMVTVVDTPGWDCTERSLQEVEREIQQILQTLNGPYSFLLVIRVGVVKAEEIHQIYRLRKVLGSLYLEHTTILFTHSDDLECKTFEEFLREGGKEFQELLRSVGHRCHSWNNRNERSDEDVEKVLEHLKNTEIKKQLEIPPKETGSCGKRFHKGTLLSSAFVYRWGEMASYTQKTSTDDSVQIVLIGNSGSGKSCSGNTILNKKHFLSDASGKSVTLRCQIETEIINGRTVTVVDTPGWDCTERSLQEVEREIQQVLQTLNGPYSFLLVIRVGLVKVEEINKIYRLKKVLGSSYLEHTTILFTHSDDLECKTFEQFLSEGGKEFQELLRSVGHRCHSWNNRNERSDEDVEKVLENLIKTEIKKQLEIPPKETGSCGKRFRKEETLSIDAQTCRNTVRVLFLGMTKGGKTSSIRNLQKHGEQTENKDVYKYVAPELSLQLIDSLGFDKNPEEIQKIICKSVSTYKPHVMMIVMNLGRFTPAKKRIMQHVQDCLGRNAAKNALILFTGTDNLEGKSFDCFIQENADLRELVSKNRNRVHALNNRDARDRRQVEELLQKIAFMHEENRGEFYNIEKRPGSVDEKG